MDNLLNNKEEKIRKSTDNQYWAVGYSWEKQGSQKNKFLNDGVWIEGYLLEGNEKYKDKVCQIKKGDILFLKETHCEGKGHSISVTSVCAVGFVTGKKEEAVFDVEWKIFEQPKKLKGTYLSQTIRKVTDQNIIQRILEEDKKENMNEISEKIENSSNLILTGAPGTGKTYSVREYVANQLGWDNDKDDLDQFLSENLFDPNDNSKKDKRYCFVQFHAGYDYTDFVEGYKPVTKDEKGNEFKEMKFELKSGIFKAFCDKAKDNLNKTYYFVIDEINRADLSRVFGELFFGLEDNYRGTHFKTQYGSDMVIPPNVKLIGTMNDVDRGVESIDFALRRRFTWYEVDAESSEVIIDEKAPENKKETLKAKMRALNGEILNYLGKEYQIGGAYFIKEDGDPNKIWNNHLRPLINEYLRGNKEKDVFIKHLKEIYS